MNDPDMTAPVPAAARHRAPTSTRKRPTRFIARAAALTVLAAVGLLGASSPAVAQACIAGTASDFDGDGRQDLAIADPDATVNGKARAGLVHIAYGDGGFQTFNQDPLPDQGADAGDRFGYALATTDWNKDGCTDLLVGVPFEALANNTVADAGEVDFIPGSPAGLVPASGEPWRQSGLGGWAGEAGDQFGYSLAAGTTTAGKPFAVMGSPGEAIGELADAGMVLYSTPDFTIGLGQNLAEAPGVEEAGDLYGYSVAATATRFAIGNPGEAIGADRYAGGFAVFPHPTSAAAPTAIAGIDQDSPSFTSDAEPGDLMGYSLDMVDYIPPGGTASSKTTLIAAGAPSETFGATLGNGIVYEVDTASGVTERAVLQQSTTSVEDEQEAGDMFGASLALINRTPASAVTWDKLMLAVGVPGEDITDHPDRGLVQAFSMIGAPGDHDTTAIGQLPSRGQVDEAGTALGSSLHAATGYLWIADPHSVSPAVYGIPWGNLTSGGAAMVLKYTPTNFGLTAADTVSFGAALA